jgi:hypothetical protein
VLKKRGLWLRQPGQKAKPYLNITRTKRIGGVAPVVEYLLTSTKPCVQTPVCAKKKKPDSFRIP